MENELIENLDAEQQLMDFIKQPLKETSEPEQSESGYQDPALSEGEGTDDEPETDTDITPNYLKAITDIGSDVIVNGTDLVMSFVAVKIAYEENTPENRQKYQANAQAKANLSEFVQTIIPDESALKTNFINKLVKKKWLVFLVLFLIAFVPVVWRAWSNRKQNQEIEELKKSERELKRKLRLMKHKRKIQTLEKRLKPESIDKEIDDEFSELIKQDDNE